jgi:signal transduction histidine kinase
MNLTHPARLTTRLMSAQLIVIAVGSTVLAVVALAVGPGLFRRHVRRAIGPVSDAVAYHLDVAFVRALALSLAVAVGGALACALLVSWLLSRRLARPARDIAHGAGRIAGGSYLTRVTVPAGPEEFSKMATAFNHMADRLESTETIRRRMLADLAHELRTPIATIEGHLEGLVDGVIDADEGTWRILGDATSRLKRLVDDIAVVSAADEHQLALVLRPSEPGVLVRRSLAALSPAFERAGVDLVEESVAASVPTVDADPDRISEVLQNLLQNALHATPVGGTVTVSVSVRGQWVDISVTDTGIGIDAEHVDRIFERFYRVDESRTRLGGGSGIGLTISWAIVDAHGGRLTVSSGGPGHGSTFTVSLPSTS